MSNLISNVNLGRIFSKTFGVSQVSKLEKMMILDVAEMDAASGELDPCISPAMCLFQVPRFMRPEGSDAFVVLAIFKKWNKKIQSQGPSNSCFFGEGGFSSYRPLFLFLRNPPRIPPPKNPTPAALVRWSEATRHLG